MAFEQHTYRYGNLWPRRTAWYSPHAYRYADNTLAPTDWPEPLLPLRRLVEAAASAPFNSVLCNQYRAGRAWMNWHSDDDYPALHMTIASLSFGATRAMELGRVGSEPRKPDAVAETIALTHGSLLIMRGVGTQEHYLHRIPKDPITDCGERINLTFRHLAGPNVGISRKKRG